jgi:site-specific recombinase XerD
MIQSSFDPTKNSFLEYLRLLGISAKSHKNYRSDLKHFSGWVVQKIKSFGSYAENLSEAVPFLSDKIAIEYKNFLVRSNVPAKTINRRLSTLRHLARHLVSADFLNQDFMNGVENIPLAPARKAKENPIIERFRSYLESEKVSPNTVKNYVNDIRQFVTWAEKASPGNSFSDISTDLVKKYQSATSSVSSGSTAKRKNCALIRFFNWARDRKYIGNNPLPPSRPVKKIDFHPRRKIDGKTFLIVGLTLTASLTLFLLTWKLKLPIRLADYLNSRNSSKLQSQFNAAAADNIRWNLYAKLKITDSDGQPLVSPQAFSFKLYDAATGGEPVFVSDSRMVEFDINGDSLISIDGLPEKLFSANNQLFFEIRVGSPPINLRIPVLTTDELSGINSRAVPVIDTTGALVITFESPVTKAEWENLLIEGQIITIKRVNN